MFEEYLASHPIDQRLQVKESYERLEVRPEA